MYVYISVESSRRVDSKLDLESSRVFDSSQLGQKFLDSPDSTSQCRVRLASDSPLGSSHLTRVDAIFLTRVRGQNNFSKNLKIFCDFLRFEIFEFF